MSEVSPPKRERRRVHLPKDRKAHQEAVAVKTEQERTRLRKKAMLKALEETLGIVTTASKKAGISRETHYQWMRDDEDYADAVRDIEDIQLDYSESKLFAAMQNGSIPAVIFHLKCKGKRRGYVERVEFQGPDGGAVPVTGELLLSTTREDLPDESMEEIFRSLTEKVKPVDFRKKAEENERSGISKSTQVSGEEGAV